MEDLMGRVLKKAILQGQVSATYDSAQHAENVRQRFYRYREKLRQSPMNPLALLADDFSFLLDGPKLIVSYKHADSTNEDIAAFLEEDL